MITVYLSPEPAHTLYECPECGVRLKTVDARRLKRHFHPMVEALLMVDLE
jgi:uncharacterized protein YlaI